MPVARSTVEGHRDEPTPAIGRVRRAWQRTTVAGSLTDEMRRIVASLHGHQRVSSRLPLTGVRGAQGQWACACPRGEDSISTDTYGQTVVCLRRQLAMISSATPATARNAKGILTEYLCGKNTFDSATLVYFVLFDNTFEWSTSRVLPYTYYSTAVGTG